VFSSNVGAPLAILITPIQTSPRRRSSGSWDRRPCTRSRGTPRTASLTRKMRWFSAEQSYGQEPPQVSLLRRNEALAGAFGPRFPARIKIGPDPLVPRANTKRRRADEHGVASRVIDANVVTLDRRRVTY